MRPIILSLAISLSTCAYAQDGHSLPPKKSVEVVKPNPFAHPVMAQPKAIVAPPVALKPVVKKRFWLFSKKPAKAPVAPVVLNVHSTK